MSPKNIILEGNTNGMNQCPGSFWAYIVGQDPSVYFKSNRLHVDIFRFCFHSSEVYTIDSSKMMGKSPYLSLQLQPVISQTSPSVTD